MPALPSDFEQMLIVAKFEAGFENWKSVLGNISLVAVASVIVMMMLVLAPIRPETAETFAASFLFPVFLLIPLAAIIFGANNVTSEFESKTGYLLFSNPVRRSVLMAGKFMASLLYVCCAVLIFYLGCSVATFYVYGTVPAGLLLSLVPALLYGCAVLALMFLFGFIFRSGVVAGALLFAVLFLCMPLLQIFLIDMGHSPWFILTYAAGAVNAFGGASMPGPATLFGRAMGNVDLIISTLVIAVYFVFLFGLNILVMRRRDIM
ncbi:MAG: ABC transporter permease subunit [Candidatus Hadarchaeales archaeon]